jgi:hypothetical protein
MLRAPARIFLNSILLASAIWFAAGDICLARRAPLNHATDIGDLIFGLGLQLASLSWLWAVINDHFRLFSALKDYVPSVRFRAGLLIAPFFMLFFSRGIIADALYNVGSIDKLENARRSDAALNCCLSVSNLVASPPSRR